eukprot:CAMPEP_0183713490 /NCGR_PEP_ID=MMETSP0737-20130205/8316_1 /TAXON_ID=385413 /ORGANISM="Thalassiosira miniscula, Strain CCMP1093" /LENGTH=370 /DNA_ID=CAMNT_0025942275 /DNA_START=33 /DNA_END=1145 /DNA_ORIENTATION=-
MLPAFIISRRYCTSIAWQLSQRNDPSSSLAFASHHSRYKRSFRTAKPLYLNRILFDASEIDKEIETADDNALATVTFSKDDYRTIHVAKILGLQNGDTLRAGSVRSPNVEEGEVCNHELAGLITDDATIMWLPEGKIKKAQPTKNGDPPGSLKISIPHPPQTSLWKERNATSTSENDDAADMDPMSDIPPVSLLLALPRPLQLGRILPMVAQLGIDQLVLTNARKVPKDYFGSHIFRKPEVLRGLLVEGLAQSGDVTLPNVTVTKRLKIFMEDEFDEMFPPGEVARVIAHPQRKDVVDRQKRMTDVEFPADKPRRILVAVGPEGGWEEPYELDMFTSKGFQQITLGTRVLRSDVAVVSLLALAHEVCATE